MNRFAFLLASTAFVSPALAADVIYEEPAAPAAVVAFDPAFTWTGFYVGGQAGVAFNYDSGPFSSTGSTFVGNSDDGETAFIGGVHVGYDHQINNLLVGVIADINYIDAESFTSFTLPTASGLATFGSVQEIDYVGTVRGKIGYAADRVAIYATGGLAYADTSNSFIGGGTFTNGAGQAFNVSANEDSDSLGYAVGGGVDYLVTQNLSLGVEYLYTDLGSSDLDVTYTPVAGGPGVAGFSTSSNSDLDFHTVWAKASFRFN